MDKTDRNSIIISVVTVLFLVIVTNVAILTKSPDEPLVPLWFPSAMVYSLPFLFIYPLSWIHFRGTDGFGNINFKDRTDTIYFLLGGLTGMLLIFALTVNEVLPS